MRNVTNFDRDKREWRSEVQFAWITAAISALLVVGGMLLFSAADHRTMTAANPGAATDGRGSLPSR
jgi:uncharacterized membrane protein